MIIDAHTHLHWEGFSEKPLRNSWYDLTYLRSLNIEKSLIFTVQGFFQNYKEANKKLIQFCAGKKDLIPFCTVNPKKGSEAIDELYKCIIDYRMFGLKLHPSFQGFCMKGREVDQVIEGINELNIPVIIHEGREIDNIIDLAIKYPKAKIILAHGGGSNWQKAVEGIKNGGNLYFCTCGQSVERIKNTIEEIGSDRILFGTDFPYHDPKIDISNLRQADINKKNLYNIFENNIRNLLNLVFS
jgi:predicted TIM-barrel fold metal-dependent hydrolase